MRPLVTEPPDTKIESAPEIRPAVSVPPVTDKTPVPSFFGEWDISMLPTHSNVPFEISMLRFAVDLGLPVTETASRYPVAKALSFPPVKMISPS